MCVPQRVVSDFCRTWWGGRGVEGQALLCEVDAAMALFAVMLEKVGEVGEEL